MVYKKYLKKGGKTFGPYYYSSYRHDGKVKKIYIGGEKEYKVWLKNKDGGKNLKKSVDQSKGIRKSSKMSSGKLPFVLVFMVLIFFIGVILGIMLI